MKKIYTHMYEKHLYKNIPTNRYLCDHISRGIYKKIVVASRGTLGNTDGRETFLTVFLFIHFNYYIILYYLCNVI